MDTPVLVLVAEPHLLLAHAVNTACRSAGFEPSPALPEIDSSAYLHDESALLNLAELTDAAAALREDGIFSETDWPESRLRAAIKYGWAIAHVAAEAANRPAGPLCWSLAKGQVATTPEELVFILEELRRREIPVTEIALCWPVTIEPGVELGELEETFLAALESYAPLFGPHDPLLRIPYAAGKFSVLSPVSQKLGAHAWLDFSGLGWREFCRLVARQDAELFRRILHVAQDHFMYDKPTEHLSTTEDDVRFLPDVPDSELERIFLEDFRGRQLLHVAANSVCADESLRSAIEERLLAPELQAQVDAVVAKHAAALKLAPAA